MKMLLAFVAAIVFLFPGSLRAAASATPAMEVVVLGSGGPRALGRAASSFLVLLDGTPRVLVDCGPGAFLRIGEMNLDLEKVDTILLTHLHIDHSSDLPAFFLARGLTADGPIVFRVFGPDGAGFSPRLRTLWICCWEKMARSPIRRHLARMKRLKCTTWRSSSTLRRRKSWMRAAW